MTEKRLKELIPDVEWDEDGYIGGEVVRQTEDLRKEVHHLYKHNFVHPDNIFEMEKNNESL